MVAARTGRARAPRTASSLFLVPTGTQGPRGQAAAHDGPDAQALRGDAARTSRSAPTRCSARRAAGWAPLARVLDRATVALCAEMCGGAQKVLDMTIEYAKIRQAFGRPIGSYQGVKHKAADMLVDVENSKSHHVLRGVGDRRERRRRRRSRVSMAKAYVSDAYRRVAGRGHPAPRRHRLHLGARPAPLLQARQGLGVHVRRRHLSPRAGRAARQSLVGGLDKGPSASLARSRHPAQRAKYALGVRLRAPPRSWTLLSVRDVSPAASCSRAIGVLGSGMLERVRRDADAVGRGPAGRRRATALLRGSRRDPGHRAPDARAPRSRSTARS